jgi:hypothetical protein
MRKPIINPLWSVRPPAPTLYDFDLSPLMAAFPGAGPGQPGPIRIERPAGSITITGFHGKSEEVAAFLREAASAAEACLPHLRVDPSLKPGTVEFRYGDRVVGRIENIRPE